MKTFLPLLRKLVIAFIFLSGVPSLYAQNWNQIIKLAAADRSDKTTSGRNVNEEFGNAVAISGDYAIIGSRFADQDSTGQDVVKDAGAAFIFHKVGGNWEKVKKISPSKRTFEANFGYAVAIQGDYIVIGAHKETDGAFNNAGAVYIFGKNAGGTENWGEINRITAPGRHEGSDDFFGFSVSISNDYLLIGAPGEKYDSQNQNPVNNSGAAYVFKRNAGGSNNWEFLRKINASSRQEAASFGYSVSVHNNDLVVGAPNENIGNSGTLNQAGAAYLFNKFSGGEDNWGQFKKLEPSTRIAGAAFGSAVAVDGNFTLIGAYKENIYDSQTGALLMGGAVYLFERNWGAASNWGQVRRLGPEYPEINEFGRYVSLKNTTAVVGAYAEDIPGYAQNAGSVFIFERDLNYYNNWGLLKKIVAPIRKNDDKFGSAVAIDGATILIGAIGEGVDSVNNTFVQSAGAAHFFLKTQDGTDNWQHKQKVMASTGAQKAHYGIAVAVHGNYAVVGASGEEKDTFGTSRMSNAGAAYILFNDNGQWKQIRKIAAPDRHAGDLFGSAVSISGDYAVVSTIWQNNGTGAAYIFKKDEGGTSNWGFIKKLTATVPTSNDWFGISVAISGDHVIVGSFGDDQDESENNFLNAAGSAYIFSRNLGGPDYWGLVQKITPGKRAANDTFGYGVAISGDYAVVNAIGQDLDENEQNYVDGAGAVYLFKKDGSGKWNPHKKLVSDSRYSGQGYGRAVGLEGENIIVSASGSTDDYKATVFLYNRNKGSVDNWGLEKKIEGGGIFTDPETQQTVVESFGTQVGLDGSNAVISSIRFISNNFNNPTIARFADLLNRNSGGAGNWGITQKISFNMDGPNSGSALPVQISGRYLLAGAGFESHDANGNNNIPDAGAVFIFVNTDSPLPVSLTAFSAVKYESTVHLTWSTASETNSDFFEIQKSTDGRKWSVLGHLAASQESNKPKTYALSDYDPVSGANLYRLKMTDRDGTFAHSRIVAVTFDGKDQIAIYPNPVAERLFIKSDSGDIESVTVTNSMGQTIAGFSKIPADGISLDQLAVGNYVIRVVKKDGAVNTKKIFVIR